MPVSLRGAYSQMVSKILWGGVTFYSLRNQAANDIFWGAFGSDHYQNGHPITSDYIDSCCFNSRLTWLGIYLGQSFYSWWMGDSFSKYLQEWGPLCPRGPNTCFWLNAAAVPTMYWKRLAKHACFSDFNGTISSALTTSKLRGIQFASTMLQWTCLS